MTSVSSVQSLWFAKEVWPDEDVAKAWVEEHDFLSGNPVHTTNHWVWRQQEPSDDPDAIYRDSADDFPDGIKARYLIEDKSTVSTRHKAGVQSSDDPFKFILSTNSVDRTGDVIDQKGWKLSRFNQNPIALFGHDHGFPIGTWSQVKVEAGRLVGTLNMAKAGTSARIDEIRSLIEQRVLRAVSVGMRILDYDPIDEKDPWGAWLIKSAELLETSVVCVPANQDAISMAKSLGVSEATQRIVFRKAGLSSTLKGTSTPRQRAKTAPADYSKLIGTPSDVVRAQRELRRQGLID